MNKNNASQFLLVLYTVVCTVAGCSAPRHDHVVKVATPVFSDKQVMVTSTEKVCTVKLIAPNISGDVLLPQKCIAAKVNLFGEDPAHISFWLRVLTQSGVQLDIGAHYDKKSKKFFLSKPRGVLGKSYHPEELRFAVFDKETNDFVALTLQNELIWYENGRFPGDAPEESCRLAAEKLSNCTGIIGSDNLEKVSGLFADGKMVKYEKPRK